MRRALSVCLLLLSLNSSACGSREAQQALVEATAATILAVGAAALEGAAQEQAERDARQAESRSRHVANEPGAWRLIREYEPDELDEEPSEVAEGMGVARDADTRSEAPSAPMPVISIGHCMVCVNP